MRIGAIKPTQGQPKILANWQPTSALRVSQRISGKRTLHFQVWQFQHPLSWWLEWRAAGYRFICIQPLSAHSPSRILAWPQRAVQTSKPGLGSNSHFIGPAACKGTQPSLESFCSQRTGCDTKKAYNFLVTLETTRSSPAGHCLTLSNGNKSKNQIFLPVSRK